MAKIGFVCRKPAYTLIMLEQQLAFLRPTKQTSAILKILQTGLLLGSGAFLFREPSWTFQNGNWLAAAHAIINHVRASVPASSSAMPHLHGQTPTATAKNKPQHKCHTTNHTARRRDFENWNVQFWWYMLSRYKRRSPQNRSNNRRPGNYGNDWVESFKTAAKQMYVVYFPSI